MRIAAPTIRSLLRMFLPSLRKGSRTFRRSMIVVPPDGVRATGSALLSQSQQGLIRFEGIQNEFSSGAGTIMAAVPTG